MNRNLAAKALSSKAFSRQIVKPRKGRGSYDRKQKMGE